MTPLLRPTVLALAVLAAFPAGAQSLDAVMKELAALRARVAELEKQAKDAAAKPAAAAPGQWGMTPDQVKEFNRITLKAEATEDNLESWGIKGLTISGYMDPTFIWNRAQKRAGTQFLNSQGDGFFYDTSYIGSASIDFTKETDSGSRYKLTLSPNRGAGAVTSGGINIVQEATVSIPLTDLQTRFIAGQVADWSGYEYQQPTLNPFITHNLLFDFTLPTNYVGAGIDYTQGKWWLRGLIANVNENIRGQGERAPALVFRVDYSKGEFDGWGAAGLFGKTANYNTGGKSDTAMLEVDGYFIRGDLTLQGQVSFGRQKQAAIVPDANGNYRDAEWTGLSGLIGYNIDPRLQILARADYIKNDKNGGGLFTYTGYWSGDPTDPFGVDGNYGDYRNGIGPDPTLACDVTFVDKCNKGANRYALSFGLKYAYNANTTFKLEYRRDGSNLPVFWDVGSGKYKKNNDLLGASVVLFF